LSHNLFSNEQVSKHSLANIVTEIEMSRAERKKLYEFQVIYHIFPVMAPMVSLCNEFVPDSGRVLEVGCVTVGKIQPLGKLLPDS
jgi:hypothetical protein